MSRHTHSKSLQSLPQKPKTIDLDKYINEEMGIIDTLKDKMYVDVGRFQTLIHPLSKPDARRPDKSYIVVRDGNIESVQTYNSGPIEKFVNKYRFSDWSNSQFDIGMENASGKTPLTQQSLDDAIKAIEDSRDLEAKRQRDYYQSRGPVSGVGNMDEMIKSIVKEKLTKKKVAEGFKVGQKVTYLGHPAEITLVDKDVMDRVYYNVSYDKGTGKTKASNIYNKGGEIKALEEISIHDPIGYRKIKPNPKDKIFTKKFVRSGEYDIFKNGKKIHTTTGGEGYANAYINKLQRELEEMKHPQYSTASNKYASRANKPGKVNNSPEMEKELSDFHKRLKAIQDKIAKEKGMNEKLTKKSSVEKHIEDFKDSDAPQFKGKSQEKRRKMAVAAYLSKKDKK